MSEARSIFPIEQMGEYERAYFEMIDRVIEAPDGELVSNGKPAHAVYLLYKFLDSAKRTVRICSGRLERVPEKWRAWSDEELAKAAIRFLSRQDTSLSILIVDEKGIDVDPDQEAADHPFIQAIQNAKDTIKGAITVTEVNPDMRMHVPHHFLVMDEEHARVETEPDKIKAYVSFNDPDFAKLLASAFDSYQQGSETLFSMPARA